MKTNTSPFKRWAWLISGVLILAVIGCITIPLGDPEKSKIDDKLIGVWLSKPDDDGSQTLFTVTGYDSRTYFVSEFTFKKADEKITPGMRIDWKAWLTDVSGQTFATGEMISPSMLLASKEDNAEKYGIVKIVHSGDTLTIQSIDDDFVKNSNVQNSQELQDLIAKNLDNAKLFEGQEPLSLTRLTDQQSDQLNQILAAFGQGSGTK